MKKNYKELNGGSYEIKMKKFVKKKLIKNKNKMKMKSRQKKEKIGKVKTDQKIYTIKLTYFGES